MMLPTEPDIMSNIILETDGSGAIYVINDNDGSQMPVVTHPYRPGSLTAVQRGETEIVEIRFRGHVLCGALYNTFLNGDNADNAFGGNVTETVAELNAFL